MITAPTITSAFSTAIEAAGLTLPAEIISDGRLHRFATNGRHDDTAGWYVLHSDGLAAGAFGCWRTGVNETWCARAEHTLTVGEREAHRARIEAVRRQREAEDRQQQEEAGSRAQRIWDVALPAPANHPYLLRKGIPSHGLRTNDENQLIVPVMIGGSMSSLQTIDVNGGKQFLYGGKVKAGAFTIGVISNAKAILLCEGFATGASVHEATGYPVAIAFSAGNLLAVSQALRGNNPHTKIIVCGDHDQSGAGQAKAREAAEAVGGFVVLPKGNGMDWNDVHRQNGLEVVRREITAVLDTPSVLDSVHDFLGRFVAYPSEHARIAHCLWIGHTHLMEEWESTPRLAFLSPEPGSGKTRALEISETLVPHPVEAINVSPAYLFRKISDPAGLPTILYDEIDTVFGPRAKEHEDLRGIINAGHRKGASAGRCVVKGKQIETEELPAFCAVAMAGLGNLPDTILTRSVIIRMRRRAPGEHVDPYRRRIHAPIGHQLRDRLKDWASQIHGHLNTNPLMPDGITDRNADVWEALLAVADAAGGDWPKRARVAAVALVAAAKGNQPSLGIRLLTDLRKFFDKQLSSAWTVDMLAALHSVEESPWADLRGKPLDSRRLANLLQPYGVTSKQVKIGGINQRGYLREDLHDAWTRYLPLKEEESEALGQPPQAAATSATNATVELLDDRNPFADSQAMEVINLVD
jgi:phage/plasmid primase-like uncharacterized protein